MFWVSNRSEYDRVNLEFNRYLCEKMRYPSIGWREVCEENERLCLIYTVFAFVFGIFVGYMPRV